ncbi:hypothetical protein [Agromyces protaetiae]|uniref:hypothetical protein n=1 Tax=Agromyces protaetiae TaxID=2509455 RepID=UPI0013EB8B8A|nr:hypothetical protein [Agromyces protaetiae]
MTTPTPESTLQVRFLTGRSDRSTTALSPAQHAFLDALPLDEAERVRVNFPYAPAAGPWRKVPLPVASVRNARDYLGARRRAFATRHTADVRAALAGADRQLVLAGSCGLELLGGLRLDDETLARVHVVAYGPVARRRPPVSLETVVGDRDGIASRRRLGEPDHRIAAGHLDYLASPVFREIVVAAIGRLRAEAASSEASAPVPSPAERLA